MINKINPITVNEGCDFERFLSTPLQDMRTYGCTSASTTIYGILIRLSDLLNANSDNELILQCHENDGYIIEGSLTGHRSFWYYLHCLSMDMLQHTGTITIKTPNTTIATLYLGEALVVYSPYNDKMILFCKGEEGYDD